ncbi:hypothetical protein HMN09_01329800 [Mycena chlorophos]|uniref:Uncharacterized protein n=1 Tax=Mycena chlorophos TaxID=658473 RepID=A0A8H6RZE4_MYCCL|nr:hypothetical protein HMN09_01329800 [Mycena chlorophos]
MLHSSSMPSVRPALELLPIELWECLAAFTDDLLELARVCVDLNAISIAYWARRQGTTPEQFLAGDAVLTPDGLRALSIYAPLAELPTTKLVVCFTNDTLLGQRHSMMTLARLVRRMPHLRDLKIHFVTPAPGHCAIDDAATAEALCSTLSGAAERNPGPVLVNMPPQHDFDSLRSKFTCWPRDIARWNLSGAIQQFNPPTGWYYQNIARPFTSKPYWWHIPTTCHDGSLVDIPPLTKPRSLHLRLGDDLGGGSLLIFDFNIFRSVLESFGTIEMLSAAARRFIPLLYRNAVLPGVRSLSLVGIDVNWIQVPLREFLQNHPRLEAIHVRYPSEPGCQAPCGGLPIVSPALAHPGIVRLETALPYNILPDRQHAVALLRGLHLSPKLERVKFTFCGPRSRSSPVLDRLLNELDCLAERSANLPRISLELLLDLPETNWLLQGFQNITPWPRFTPSLEIAASLHCIRSVSLKLPSVKLARMLLPWLAALPALEDVALFIMEELSSSVRVWKLLQETRSALGVGTQVHYISFGGSLSEEFIRRHTMWNDYFIIEGGNLSM